MLTCWHGVLLVERNATDVAGLAVHEDPRSGTGVARAQRGKANGMPSTLLIDGNTTESAVNYQTRKLYPNWDDKGLHKVYPHLFPSGRGAYEPDRESPMSARSLAAHARQRFVAIKALRTRGGVLNNLTPFSASHGSAAHSTPTLLALRPYRSCGDPVELFAQ
jgi:hypothetical protein